MSKQGPILIIDDDVDDLELLSQVINDYFGRPVVRSFVNGHQALDFLYNTRDQPFMIICDINMPGMNGLELCQHIYDDDYLRKKSIPFIFLSTGNNPNEIERAYDLTVQGYFKKPSKLSELNHMVAQIIDYWKICLHPNSFK